MRTISLLSLVLLAAVPARADAGREALGEVARCADISSVIERLACFDIAAKSAKSALGMAPAAGQKLASPAAQEEEEGGILDWFGFSSTKTVTKPAEFGLAPRHEKAAGPKEVTEISASVVNFSRNPLGRAIFTLDNGQVWKQVSGDSSEVREPSSGERMKVTIEKAVFGSYSLSISGRNGLVKVQRVK